MSHQSEHVQQNESQAVSSSQESSSATGAIATVDDKRPEAAVIRQLKTIANASSINANPVQRKEGGSGSGGGSANATGLPNKLKSGVENLSGHSMDDVSVHYNSDKPAQLQAHAYAQGTDIHLAPGQEQHLPHEAWHVVQQKQGRVKPTTQLKGKIDINDDAGLEREADVMGQKALGAGNADKSEKLQSKSVGQIFQMVNRPKEDEGFELIDDPEEFDERDDLDEIGSKDGMGDVDVSETEEELNDFSDVAEDMVVINDFDRVKEQDNAARIESSAKVMSASEVGKIEGEKGGDRQFEFTGEVGLFNRWRNTTYAKLIEIGKKFNDSKDASQKQAYLKELKPLARHWLFEHEAQVQSDIEKGKASKSDMDKLSSVYNFLRQTTTNYPEIVQIFRSVQSDLEAFRSGHYLNRTFLFRASSSYAKAKQKEDNYKKTFPPSVNLLYQSEVSSLAEHEAALGALSEKGAPAAGFDTGHGFSLSGTTVDYNLGNGSLSFNGDISFKAPGLSNSAGKIYADYSNSGILNKAVISDGSCLANFADRGFELSGISYDLDQRVFKADSARSLLRLKNTLFEVNAENVEFDMNGGFEYSLIKGSSNEIFDTEKGIQVKNPRLLSYKGQSYDVRGELATDMPGINEVKGIVAVTLEDTLALSNIKIKNGSANASLVNETTETDLTFQVTGFSYNYETGSIFAKEASGKGQLLGVDAAVSAEAFKRSPEGEVSYTILRASSTETFDTEKGIKVTNPRFLAYKGEKYDLRGELEMELDDIAEVKGQVAVNLDQDKALTNIKIKNGSGVAKYENDAIGTSLTFALVGFSYNYSTGNLFAKEASGKGKFLDKTVEASVEGLRRSSKGEYSYTILRASSTETFDTEKGIKVINPKLVGYKGERYDLSGELEMELDDIAEAKGQVEVNLDQDKALSNITIIDGSAAAQFEGINFDLKGFSYDSGEGTFVVEKAKGTFSVFGREVTLNAEGVTIDKSGFDFEKLKGKAEGKLETPFGVTVNDPFIAYVKGHVLLVKGKLSLDTSDGTTADGVVSVAMDTTENHEVRNVMIADGNINTSFAGFEFKLNGLGFDYQQEKYSSEKAIGEGSLFEHKISLTAEGVEYSAKKGLDFNKISGILPAVDYGVLKINSTEIAYNKEKSEFQAKTSYAIEPDGKLGLSDFETKGDLHVSWSKEKGTSIVLENGAFNFQIAGQKAVATGVIFNSKEKQFNIGKFDLNLAFADLKKKFDGTGVVFNKDGIDFKSLSMEAGSEEINLQVLKLKPSRYSILKDDSGGYALKADGSLDLSLPEMLGVKSEGSLKGDVSYNFKDKKANYHLLEGGANAQVPNPLYKLGSLIGSEGGASGNFELGGSVPVFPGVSATFGVFLRFAASFGEFIEAKINYSPEKDAILFHIGTSIDAKVGVGAYIGVQAGYSVILSIEVRLEAGGEIKVQGNFGYGSEFPMNQKPKDIAKLDKSVEGITYGMEGDIKLKAALALIASALYFFRKDFRIELGDGYELGSFTLDKENGFQLNPTKKDLASDEDLKKKVDPALKEEYEKREWKAKDLLDYDFTKRFSNEDKVEALANIKSSHEEYKTSNAASASDKGPSFFNDTWLANLQGYNKFVDNRCNWAVVFKIVKNDINSSESSETYLKAVHENMKLLGESINLATDFVDYYEHRVKRFDSHYSALYSKDSAIQKYKNDLDKKVVMLKALNDFKKGYLHSQFWGDERFQNDNMNKESRLWGLIDDKYTTYVKNFNAMAGVVKPHANLNKEISQADLTIKALMAEAYAPAKK